MTALRQPQVDNDFDTSQLVQISDHEKLSGRVSELEKLGTVEGFSHAFCKVAAESVTLRASISEIMTWLISRDEPTRNEIRKFIEGEDRKRWVSLLYTGRGWVSKGLIYAAGAVTTALVYKLIGK